MWAKYKWWIIAAVILLIIILIYVYYQGKKYRPSTVILPPDVQPGGATTFDPSTYTNAIHTDVTCYFCMHDSTPYADANALSNSQLVAIYNDWNKRYYEEDSETIVQAIKGERDTFGLNYAWQYIAGTLISRYESLGLN